MVPEYPKEASNATPDAEKAVAFLESIAGGHPVTVGRICPKDGFQSGDTFDLPPQREELKAWHEKWNGKQNLHYSINAAARGRRITGSLGKLKEADVAFLRGLVVDLDPQAGKPFEDERRRLREVVKEAENHFLVEPTIVVDSGGGYQMIWLFPQPIAVDDKVAVDVKAQARGIGKLYGSDAVHSLEHLFRLPWSTNLPNEAKVTKGQKTATAKIVSDSGGMHELRTLKHLADPIYKSEQSGNTSLPELDYSAVLEVLGTPEELPERLRSIALECASCLEDIAGDAIGDRSTTDYRVAAHVIREHGITDATDLACITFAVSPERLTQDEGIGKGEGYCRGTIGKVLAQIMPRGRPEDFFDAVVQSDLDAADALNDMFAAPEDAKRPRIEILKYEDIRRLKPPEFVIGRHLPEQSFGFLYGDPGSYKSFLALDWSLHIASGLDEWHGDRIKAKPNGWVVYLAREGSSGIQVRLDAWRKAHPTTDAAKYKFALVPSSIDLMDKECVNEIVESVRAAQVEPISMIVVDTVSRSMPGADENSQKDMTRFVAACDVLKDTFECVVLGVHHTTKTNGSLRGSSVLHGAGDFEFRVSKADAPVTNCRVTMTCEKMKDGPDGWKEDYFLDRVELDRQDEDGKPITSLVPRRAPQVELSEAQDATARQWAGIVMGALGGRDEAPWAALSDEVQRMALAQGLTKKKMDPSRFRAEASKFLSGQGAETNGPAGQLVIVSMSQPCPGKPWTVRKTIFFEQVYGDAETFQEAAE